jgi:hypothetical protein
LVSVNAAKSEPPTPCSRALARVAQQRERERAARKKERATRHRKRRERRSEEFRLREQQGLSSPGTEEYSSSDEEEEEEEEVRGQALPDRWEPAPPYGSPSTASLSPSEDALANHYAFTLEAAPVQVRDAPRQEDRGKDCQDDRQLRGAARHTSTCS